MPGMGLELLEWSFVFGFFAGAGWTISSYLVNLILSAIGG